MFSRCASQWNAVNVIGCDGLLHRGLVVNRSETGLTIDFGIKNKEPELVSYDWVLRDTKNRFKRELLNQDVELLYQVSDDQEWKWFPAQLLSQSWDKFLLVDMRTEGVHVTAVFRKDRVRARCARLRVSWRRNDFIKDDVPVKSGFLVTNDFCDRWKRWFPKTHPVGVEEGRLFYIQRRKDKETDLGRATVMVNMKESEAYLYIGLQPRGIKRPFGDLLADETKVTKENNSWISQLPLEILAEVFNHMEIVKQTQLRRVCVRFDYAVSSRACNVTIVHSPQGKMDSFIFASAIYTTLSRRTAYVIITTDKFSVDKHITVLQQMVTAAGSIIPHLVLVNVAITDRFLLDGPDRGISRMFRSIWPSICSHLVLRNVTVREALGKQRSTWRFNFEDVHVGYCAVNTDDEPDFRQVFEANCNTPAERDLCRLGEWIKDLSRDPWGSIRGMIITDLKHWQYDDSRFGRHCTWKDVELANLAKNMGTLRNTTLYALLIAQDNCRLSVVSSSDESEVARSISDDSSTDSDYCRGNCGKRKFRLQH